MMSIHDENDPPFSHLFIMLFKATLCSRNYNQI
jgi:hypothetical protein